VNSSVFSRFLNSTSDVEERIPSSKLFLTEVTSAENDLSPMVIARLLVRTPGNDQCSGRGEDRMSLACTCMRNSRQLPR